jgi:Rieske 2Fe-2S family protein
VTTSSPATLLDRAALTAATAPFGRSRMLPPAAYTSAEVFAWEQRRLFADSWTCVGRESDLRAGGLTQRAVSCGDVGVLLTFDGPDGLGAYANTCAHRNHELLPVGDTTTRRSIRCTYHAWTYGLDGSLHQAPGFRADVDFDPAQHGLVPLPVERWGGWVFVYAAASEAPVAFGEHLGAMAGLVEPYAPERLVVGARHAYDVAANWKVITENYHECYHCPLIHPELCQVSPPTSGQNYDLPGSWVGGSMDLRPDAETMSLDGSSRGVPLPGVDQRRVEYLGLLPNLLVSAHPDYVMTHRLVPLAPDRTHVECSWLFADADPAVDPSYAVDFWDLTNRQDWAACESVQRGLASPHARAGPLAPNEDAVHRFVSMIAAAYLAG